MAEFQFITTQLEQIMDQKNPMIVADNIPLTMLMFVPANFHNGFEIQKPEWLKENDSYVQLCLDAAHTYMDEWQAHIFPTCEPRSKIVPSSYKIDLPTLEFKDISLTQHTPKMILQLIAEGYCRLGQLFESYGYYIEPGRGGGFKVMGRGINGKLPEGDLYKTFHIYLLIHANIPTIATRNSPRFLVFLEEQVKRGYLQDTLPQQEAFQTLLPEEEGLV